LPPTQTTPTNSQTGKSLTSPTLRPPSSTSSSTTTDPNNPPSSNVNFSSSSKRAVAIGATLGAFAFLVILSGTAYYLRRRQHGQEDARFIALGGDERGDGADSPHFDGEIPAVSTHGDPVRNVHGGNRGLLSSLGLAGAISAATRMRNVRSTYQRRDMLADEDTRSFGEWHASRVRDGTGGSSWSLKSILGGGTRLASRAASTASRGTNAGSRNTPWREKSDLGDGTSLLRDEDTGFMEVVTTSGPTRPRANGRRLMSQASSKSGLSYKDPFSDPVQEERRQRSDASDPLLGEEDGIEDPLRFSVRHVPALPSIITTLPLSQGGHALSALSEQTHNSHYTLTIPESSTATSSHAHSSETWMTPFGGSSSFGTSRTSVDPFPPIIGTVYNDIRRTDSWWSRFTRTNLLDRRLSDASRKSATGGKFEIRDPKPPPRLDAIEENVHLSSSSQTLQEEPSLQQQQQGPTLGRAVSMVYEAGHGKSMSSVRTADSEAIERMAGTMDVFQRIKTRSNSNRTTGSINSTGGFSMDTLGSSIDAGHNNYVSGGGTSQGVLQDDLPTFSSPAEILPLQAPSSYDALEYSPPRLSSPPLLSTHSSPREDSIRPIAPPSPLLLKSAPMSPSSPSVAERIHAFENRMSLEQQTSSPPATNTKYREERTKKRVTVDYGLVPRANLFVANPDSHRLSTSGDS
jgi:hypothetical protein